MNDVSTEVRTCMQEWVSDREYDNWNPPSCQVLLPCFHGACESSQNSFQTRPPQLCHGSLSYFISV